MSGFTLMQKLRNKIKIKGLGNKVLLDDKKTLKLANTKIYIKGDNNILHIKKNVNIRNSFIEIVGNDCSIVIGENCIVGYDCYLSAKETDIKLSIGDNCMLSRNAKLMTSDGHPIFHENKIINKAENITLHNNIWIADNVTILKGVDIGSHSVVGIDAVLTKSIPSHSVAVGNPAKVVKNDISWEH